MGLSLWWSVLTKIVSELLFSQKSSIINVKLGSKYACVACKEKRNKLSYVKNIKLYVPFFMDGVFNSVCIEVLTPPPSKTPPPLSC